MDADQILVLDAGKVVGQRYSPRTLTTNESIKEIAYSQLSKEELGMEIKKPSLCS